jgi:NAD+ synthase
MFSRDALCIDAPVVAREIASFIHRSVLSVLRRRGAVVAISGGVDSAVVAALCARALGPERVLGLLMPERDSSSESLRLGLLVAQQYGIPTLTEDIGPALEAIGAYQRQTDAIRQVFDDYCTGTPFKLTLPSILESDRLAVFALTVQRTGQAPKSARMRLEAYRQLVAATNFKQRVRKMVEYHHADRICYAVAGTPNRLEFDQGFFVKQGDGAADFKPIAHLYKTQVYALAEHLGVPEVIRSRPPTTDTFSLPQTQEEFYFSLPYQAMDLCIYAHDHGIDAAEAARVIGITAEQCARVYRDIVSKRRATAYLHASALIPTPLADNACRDSRVVRIEHEAVPAQV